MNRMPIPGSRWGSPGPEGAAVQRTTPLPRMTWSPEPSEMSSSTSVPGGRGSRVRMKMPPREMFRA